MRIIDLFEYNDTANAFGGVLINNQGQILLREPTNHYGGYVWTYAKGRRDPGDSPEETALREVKEETGYDAEIIKRVPGVFYGDTSGTVFYLMKPIGEQGQYHWETSQTKWVSFDEAAEMISMTESPAGKRRDLEILSAVKSLLKA